MKKKRTTKQPAPRKAAIRVAKSSKRKEPASAVKGGVQVAAKKSSGIVRVELNELSRGSTDWKRVAAMRDEDIVIDDDAPEMTEDFWKNAKPFVPSAPKRQVSVRLDPDVLEWFKGQGDGFTTHINAVLKSYMHAKRKV